MGMEPLANGFQRCLIGAETERPASYAVLLAYRRTHVPEQERQAVPSKRLDRDKMVRLALRALPLPFVPGPELYDLLRDLQRSRTAVGAKVERAVKSLTEASELVAELQAELTERVEKVGKLQAEYEKYEQLAKVEEGKARALIDQIEETVGRGRSRERWIALGINLAAGIIVFLLGVIAGPRITAWLWIGG